MCNFRRSQPFRRFKCIQHSPPAAAWRWHAHCFSMASSSLPRPPLSSWRSKGDVTSASMCLSYRDSLCHSCDPSTLSWFNLACLILTPLSPCHLAPSRLFFSPFRPVPSSSPTWRLSSTPSIHGTLARLHYVKPCRLSSFKNNIHLIKTVSLTPATKEKEREKRNTWRMNLVSEQERKKVLLKWI